MKFMGWGKYTNKIKRFGVLFFWGSFLILFQNCAGDNIGKLAAGISSGNSASSGSSLGLPVSAPHIANLTSTQTRVSWVLDGGVVTSLSLNGTNVLGSNFLDVAPSVTTTYILVATNQAGFVTDSTTITVALPSPSPSVSPSPSASPSPVITKPTITSMTSSPSTINAGGTSKITWSLSGSATTSLRLGGTNVSGTTANVTPTVSTTYSLTATNSAGSDTQSLIILVFPASSGTWIPCGDEGTQCAFTNTHKVIFGFLENSLFASTTATNGVSCDNSIFGDPAPNHGKSCWYESTALPDPTPSPSPSASPSPTGSPSTGSSTSATFNAMDVNASILANPEKGLVDYAANNFLDGPNTGGIASEMTAGTRMVFCLVDLAAYRNTTLTTTSAPVTALANSLVKVRDAGVKCQMLFGYDFNPSCSGGNCYGNDASPAIIKNHLAAFSSVLHQYADVIPYLRAGFIGAWGQWVGSLSGNTCGWSSKTSCPDTNVQKINTDVKDELLAAVDPATSVGFAAPIFMYQWNKNSLTASQAFSGSDQSRIGMENDCALGGYNGTIDFGEFNDNQSLGTNPSYLMSYAQQNSKYQPYFGELSQSCGSGLVTDCASAKSYLAQYHASNFKMIGSDAAPWVNSWKAGGCYNEIINRMGYRFELKNVSHQSTASSGQTITVKAMIQNTGYSRIFTKRKLVAQACLGSTCYSGNTNTFFMSTGAVLPVPNTGDLRSLPEQATSATEVDVPITIPAGAAPGNYEIRLSIPDIGANTAGRDAFAIQFANSNNGSQTWHATGAYMTTGTTLVVQ